MCGFTGEFVEQNKECYKQKAIDESMELQRRDVKVYRPADIIMELKSLPVLLCIFARNKTETRYPDALTLTLTLKLELLRVCSFSIPTLHGWDSPFLSTDFAIVVLCRGLCSYCSPLSLSLTLLLHAAWSSATPCSNTFLTFTSTSLSL